MSADRTPPAGSRRWNNLCLLVPRGAAGLDGRQGGHWKRVSTPAALRQSKKKFRKKLTIDFDRELLHSDSPGAPLPQDANPYEFPILPDTE